MPLPTIQVANFTLKKSEFIRNAITMRPFLVGEETILLQVKDSEDESEIMSAVKQVINQCVVEPKGMDVSDAPPFVLELMFLRLRQNSNGEVVELDYRCKNETEGKPCNQELQIKLDLRNADIHAPEGHQVVFDVDGSCGVKLKYPTIRIAEELEDPNDWVETVAMSIDSIFKGEDVWLASDHTKEELMTFTRGMTSKTKAEIQDKFFGRIPTVKSFVKTKCPKCGVDHNLEITGLKEHFD